MKLVKMSMVAALVLGANLYAIDNVKVNGNAKVYYGTVDSDATDAADMFDKDASFADAALHLGLTADLTTGVTAGVSMTAVSTLGLENNLVSGTWSNAHSATTQTGASFLNADHGGASVDDEMWVGEAWIAGTAGKTTAKLGRQALDTPLAFTETWGIDQNTFEAAVLINQDLPDTTLVGAWIGKSNGSADSENVTIGTTTGKGTLNTSGAAKVGYVAEGGKFNTFAKDGAYAVGAINNSFKPLTAQAWYYELPSMAKAYWLQADLSMEGILAGAQYTSIDVNGANDDDTAYGLMLGYEMKDVVTIKAAYSSVDDQGAVGNVGNLATTTQQSKLYTEMFWNRGVVSATGADSFKLSASGKVSDIDLSACYTNADIKTTALNTEVTEVALVASKSYGPLDTRVAAVYTDDDANAKSTTVLVQLAYNF
ncbi:MAG: hypothetical protein IBX43_10955 [Campylobacterales bacterium]|nr:hypothetical protein [Campylobacterales bacterium]